MKYLLTLFLVSLLVNASFAQLPSDLTVLVKVTTQTSPKPQISMTWPLNTNATNYKIYKKAKTDGVWNVPVTIAGTSTSWIDTSVVIGQAYEYQIECNKTGVPARATSYLYAGIETAPLHFHGKMILLIDANYVLPLQTELQQLKIDLITDGWMVFPVVIPRNLSVDSVKKIAQTIHAANYSIMNSVLIIGHVPVPYSGNLNPDGHPDHLGAWPCDAFYGDVDGNWTDNSVNNTVASRAQNQNLIGDGKYDQSNLPSYTEMNVGRIDLFNLPAFTLSDTQLVKNYLLKNHAFKYAQKNFSKRMLIDDNFGFFGGEAFAQNGWRNGLATLGPDSIFNGDYFTDLANTNYLWSYGTGGGTYTSAGGIGATSDYANIPLKNAFTMTFGSYFGDWDSQDNFLRAALANPGDILTNCWAGRPNWFFHYLTLGESFSEAVSISQNNFFLYTPLNYGYNGVHIGFMGDVSLRQDYFYPCNNLTSSAISNNSKVQLNWAASAASGVLGYYLYRAKSINDTFFLVTPNKIGTLTYIDSFPLVGTNVYQVRAVRLEYTATGSYYNLSLGRIDSIQNSTPLAVPNIAPLQAAVYPNPIKSNGTMHLTLNQFTSGSMILLNTLAQVQLQQNFNNSKQLSIGLPNLAAGVYFLQVQTKSGILLKKIIISD